MLEPAAEQEAPRSGRQARLVIGEVRSICERHGITALDAFISACENFAHAGVLNIAIIGRFKAGKSSFLNHLLGTNLLPVGVIPVTSVVTEVEWGEVERVRVEFQNGVKICVDADSLPTFVAEAENPENAKRVKTVRIETPAMAPYRGIRFVDTPGLESVFSHNTQTSLDWLPNVGMALIAVGVDPPLTRSDIDLIRQVARFTPHIGVLLTKVDILDDSGREEVLSFVAGQLREVGVKPLTVYPYSNRPGFETLRQELASGLLESVSKGKDAEQAVIIQHKANALAAECESYLRIALRTAEASQEQRNELERLVLGNAESLEDVRTSFRITARHATQNTRSAFEALLRSEELPIRQKLLHELKVEYPRWTTSLASAADQFDNWLRVKLTAEISAVSTARRTEFLVPLMRTGRQLERELQDFRNRVSMRTLESLGMKLDTTEQPLTAREPSNPDIFIGKIFDHNWELFSWLIPMGLVKGAIHRHFAKRLEYLVFANLSRLATQWEESVNGALGLLEKDAQRRFEDLVGSLRRIISSQQSEIPGLHADLERLSALRSVR
ncbi:MAG: dynamin family protein [Acidobacteria bacterium]|nr:dynamin family protein [Acidobacteriota bacterium]